MPAPDRASFPTGLDTPRKPCTLTTRRVLPLQEPVAAARETMHLSWAFKCATAWAVLAAVASAVAVQSGVGAQQKCVPPGPGLTLNDFLSGKFYLFERQQAFSIKLLQTAVAASPKQNLIFSPHSIYTALLIAYFLSSNRTEESLRSFLNLPPEQVPLCERAPTEPTRTVRDRDTRKDVPCKENAGLGSLGRFIFETVLIHAILGRCHI